MAAFGAGDVERGRLDVEFTSPTRTTVYFDFLDWFERAAVADGEEVDMRPRMVEFDAATGRVSIYPIGTLPIRESVGRPKYGKLHCISVPLRHFEVGTEQEVMNFLENLPRGLTKDPQFGLGLPREYYPIIEAIEELTNCTELYLTQGESRGVVDHCFVVSFGDFEEMRALLDRIRSRANIAALHVRRAHAGNWVRALLGVDEVEYRRGRNPMIQHFADAAAGKEALNDRELDELLGVVETQSRAITRARPEALSKLKSDIEMVELDGLIDRFRAMLNEGRGESAWQQFFQENPFVLSFALSYPLILVQDQASVGGRKLAGGGEKITDFLAKNPTTNNVALFEIKKPGSPLLQPVKYRGGVFRASGELSGSIAQVLDQRYQFTKSIASIRDATRGLDIESFAVKACLIIGRTPPELDQVKSFELLRKALTDVEIITFDELLIRAETLRAFLIGNKSAE